MAVTKILARHARLDVAIKYALNGDKTQEKVYTARMNCVEGFEYPQMKMTKKACKKEDGVQSYHIVLIHCYVFLPLTYHFFFYFLMCQGLASRNICLNDSLNSLQYLISKLFHIC